MFNLLVGRELQGMMGQKPQQCFLMPILVGTDGVQKMSKSLGNYIALEESADDMYGKVMSLPDNLIVPYFEYLTDIKTSDLEAISSEISEDRANPMEFKKQISWDITNSFHGRESATDAQTRFEAVVQGRNIPIDIPTYDVSNLLSSQATPLNKLLVETGLAASSSEAKRLINQQAVELIRESEEAAILDNNQITSWHIGDIIKVGKRRFVKLV